MKKINIINKSILVVAAFVVTVLTLFASGVVYAGVNRNFSGSHPMNRSSNIGYTGSRGTITHTVNTTGLARTANTSFTANNGNMASHEGKTSVNTNSGGTKEVEHSGKIVVANYATHESIHRDSSTSVNTYSDGTKNLDHSVSAERNSVGTTINGHQADTHASTQTHTFTHDGWAVGNAKDGVTTLTHDGNTSISKDSDGIKYIAHTDTTAESFQETRIKTHEGNKQITISPH